MQKGPVAFVIDGDEGSRRRISDLLRSVQIEVATFGTAREFLSAQRPDAPGCLILEVRLPDMSGLELQAEISNRVPALPIIFTTAYADVPMSVQAMKAGAFDFLCMPVREETLLASVRQALRKSREGHSAAAWLWEIQTRYDTLTSRERQIMNLVVSGLMNKQIAGHLGLSEITVKVHRASIMRKMMVRSLAELVRSADALAGSLPHSILKLLGTGSDAGGSQRAVNTASANLKFRRGVSDALALVK